MTSKATTFGCYCDFFSPALPFVVVVVVFLFRLFSLSLLYFKGKEGHFFFFFFTPTVFKLNAHAEEKAVLWNL